MSITVNYAQAAQNDTNNDASPIFASIPVGSTVAVQQEDGGPWTHGMIVGKGDNNHHDQSYTIQLTTSGRRITCNRQHIRQTSITADSYICYQAMKKANRQIDPLDAILEHIKNNPQSYSNRTVQSNSNKTQSMHDKQQPINNLQGNRQVHMQIMQQAVINTRADNNRIQQGENVVKTRYGRTIRKPDRLTYH